jgi:hypothetical protein
LQGSDCCFQDSDLVVEDGHDFFSGGAEGGEGSVAVVFMQEGQFWVAQQEQFVVFLANYVVLGV